MSRAIKPPRGESTHRLAGRVEVADRRYLGSHDAGLHSTNQGPLLARYTVLLDGDVVGTVEQVHRDAFRWDAHGNRPRSGRGRVAVWLLTTTDGIEYVDYADRSLAITLYDSLSSHLGLSI